ncbi:RNA polymerase sigma factor (sigma-70 family) [Catalinimonas alkaloidigena]|uniref:RNA polymerase sigma factor n=1 Tax=Catalinimonas alkaloidigena TaxID=1075417 RepID=UPI002405FCFD|nr:sigma-70 family RNA polymerase sigma factor [Catalinimonas alkaloidigena]MDF9796382.1 RNA polymerase sigma factor (sigma-70 family) [Catalinimonas alkaloidigena]
MHRKIRQPKHLTTEDWEVTKPKNPESKLWSDMLAGDQLAYTVIYQKFFSPLYHYGIKISNEKSVVEDCIQDLFVEIWQRRNNLKETDSIAFYLFASLKRKIIKVQKKNSLIDNNSLSHMHITDTYQEERIIKSEINDELKQKISDAMHMLTKRQRESIKLKYFYNANNEEIAKRLSIKVESAYNLVFKAMTILRKQISNLILATCLIKYIFN